MKKKDRMYAGLRREDVLFLQNFCCSEA